MNVDSSCRRGTEQRIITIIISVVSPFHLFSGLYVSVDYLLLRIAFRTCSHCTAVVTAYVRTLIILALRSHDTNAVSSRSSAKSSGPAHACITFVRYVFTQPGARALDRRAGEKLWTCNIDSSLGTPRFPSLSGTLFFIPFNSVVCQRRSVVSRRVRLQLDARLYFSFSLSLFPPICHSFSLSPFPFLEAFLSWYLHSPDSSINVRVHAGAHTSTT